MFPYFSKIPVWLKTDADLEALRGRRLRVILSHDAVMHMILKLGVYKSRAGENYVSVMLTDPTADQDGGIYLTNQTLGWVARDDAMSPSHELVLDLRAQSRSNLKRYLPCLHACP